MGHNFPRHLGPDKSSGTDVFDHAYEINFCRFSKPLHQLPSPVMVPDNEYEITLLTHGKATMILGSQVAKQVK